MTAAFRIPRAPSGFPAMLVQEDGQVVGFVCTSCESFQRLALTLDCPPDEPGSHSCRCGQWHEVAAGHVTAL